MKLSIIIVSWNVQKLLEGCLESIEKYAQGISHEVIVVDNASSDQTVEMIKQRFPTVRLIENNSNKGFAAANNQGALESSGEYLLLLNPDTELQKGTLENVLTCLESNPKIGVLGCKHLHGDLTLQPSVRTFPTVWVVLLILSKLARILPGLPSLKRYYCEGGAFDYHQSQAVDQVQGSFFLIRRQLIDQIGLLDEKFWIWFEEVDYCKRAIQAGWLVYYCANAQIIHHGGSSFRQLPTFNKQRLFAKSAWYYFTKHGFFSS